MKWIRGLTLALALTVPAFAQEPQGAETSKSDTDISPPALAELGLGSFPFGRTTRTQIGHNSRRAWPRPGTYGRYPGRNARVLPGGSTGSKRYRASKRLQHRQEPGEEIKTASWFFRCPTCCALLANGGPRTNRR